MRSLRSRASMLLVLCLLTSTSPFARAEQEAPEMVLNTYQVADLVIPVTTGPKGTPKAPLAFMVNKARTEVRVIKTTGTIERQLIELITQTIAPKSWVSAGGKGTIEFMPLTLSLVVNQLPAVQKEVKNLLTALRILQDAQTTLQVEKSGTATSLGSTEYMKTFFATQQPVELPPCFAYSAAIPATCGSAAVTPVCFPPTGAYSMPQEACLGTPVGAPTPCTLPVPTPCPGTSVGTPTVCTPVYACPVEYSNTPPQLKPSRTDRVLNELRRAYEEACAEGKTKEAAKIARTALTLDPTCFSSKGK